MSDYVTRNIPTFLQHARAAEPDFGPPTARAAFLVAPDGFRLADQSATDNHYMAGALAFDEAAASAQHRALHRAMSAALPTVCFSGNLETPDAVFPNNVFATAPGRYVVGRMRHPVRQREAARDDIRGFFGGVLGYEEVDLSTQTEACELTGAVVVDRARGLGFAGLSERCTEAGARLVHEALGLRATLMFELAPGEYHTNVVLAVLGGRAALICPDGFADAAVGAAIAAFYAPHAVLLSAGEHAAFAANAIALSESEVWMSRGADESLTAASRQALVSAGFKVVSVAIDAIEAGGGSLRCCVGEIY
ncbi:MAG: arginine deiminase-related protein [Pseudomonadota bacterium]|nr:arginine deiminase-related protein [Pseudomonadota bacterium]